MSCKSTNSSNVNTILSPLKLRVESAGSAFTKRGGKESLGPPSGGIILAQPGPVIKLVKKIMRVQTNKKTDFMMSRKHKLFLNLHFPIIL